MNKRLNYLNLELCNYSKTKRLIDSCHLDCNIDCTFKHLLHSSNEHLNGITDLLINLANNLESDISVLKASVYIEQTNKQIYTEIIIKLDYIKNTKENRNIELITHKITSLKDRISTIEDSLTHIKDILSPDNNITNLINEFKTLNIQSNQIGKKQNRNYYGSWKTNSK